MALNFGKWGNDLYTGRKSYNIVGRRWVWFSIGISLIVISILFLVFKGFNPGIEFSGGSEFVVSGVSTTEQSKAVDAVQSVEPNEEPRVSQVGSDSLRVQTSELTNEQVEAVKTALQEAYSVDADQVTSAYVGPSWGKDVSTKAAQGVVIFLVLVGITMTIYFRAWRMAVAAIVALIHDLIITVGIYCAIGWEVTPASVIGFLTILGYSIYDTVVVFDKVRENTQGVLEQSRYTYEEAANLAVNQTLVRSINTSVIALLPVSAVLFVGAFLLGAGTVRDIALALFIGMLIGAFSSVFIATPGEVMLRDREPAIRAHTARVLAARAARREAGEDVDEVAASAAPVLPGQHLGQSAQPRRKDRR